MVSGGSFGHNEVHLHLRGEEELQDFSFYFYIYASYFRSLFAI